MKALARFRFVTSGLAARRSKSRQVSKVFARQLRFQSDQSSNSQFLGDVSRSSLKDHVSSSFQYCKILSYNVERETILRLPNLDEWALSASWTSK